MKKTYLIILTIVLAGCSGFLDEEMQGVYSSGTFYQTGDHAELALTGVYNATSFSSPNNNIWVFGDVASDDAVKGGYPGDQTAIQFIDEFSYQSSNAYLLNMWTYYYEGVTRANYLLASLPNIDMDANRKTVVHGETLFLRSYFYYHLVNVFGSIPLKLNPPVTQGDINVPLSSVEDIYKQLVTDLTQAADDLPVKNDMGHVSRGGALGLIAKLKLFQQDYDGVLTTIDQIDALGVYALVDFYRHNFMLDFQNNQESLFEVEHLTAASPKLGSALNQWFAPQPEGGYHFNAPTQDFVDEFEMTKDSIVDPRLDYSVGRAGQPWLDGEPFDPTWSTTGYLNKKHQQPLAEVPKGIKGDGGLDYVFMRYAEVLLMKAEALNEKGQTALALAPLNAVRKRARESYLYDESLDGYGTVPAGLLPDVTSTDASVVREAIRHERRVELGLEFHRYFDLMRYGKVVAEKALSNTNFNYDQNRYFAIPLTEQDLNKGIN